MKKIVVICLLTETRDSEISQRLQTKFCRQYSSVKYLSFKELRHQLKHVREFAAAVPGAELIITFTSDFSEVDELQSLWRDTKTITKASFEAWSDRVRHGGYVG